MLAWLKKLRRRSSSNAPEAARSAPPPPPPPTPKAAPPPPPPRPRVPGPPSPATMPQRGEFEDGMRVALIMRDGTSVSPPDDPESEERFRYLARNLIPGAGSSGKNDGDNV